MSHHYHLHTISYSAKRKKRPTRVRNTPQGPIPGHNIQPIRSVQHIYDMEDVLSETGYCSRRNVFLWQLALNTGLRISDVLWLCARHVRHGTHIVQREIKTGKIRQFLINDQLRAIIDAYIEGMDDDDYLFGSTHFPHTPIERNQAYRIFRTAGERIGLNDIGSHTCRKTFGYHHYRMRRDLVTLMLLFNHSSEAQTLKYIGWNQTAMDEAVQDFYLGRPR